MAVHTIHQQMFDKSLYEPEDINRDGKVDNEDLLLVIKYLGTKVNKDGIKVNAFGDVEEIFPNPDVNRDGIVDKNDLDLVIKMMDDPGDIITPPKISRILPTKWADVKTR